MMIPVHQMTLLDAVVLIGGLCLLLTSVRILRHRVKSTQLRGPSSKSLIFGNSHFLRQQTDSTLVYEEWAEQYGAVFCTPIALGKTQIILCDPKAIQHFFSKDTYGYVQNAIRTIFVNNMVGKGLLWAEGDSHKRQRKALTPAFGTTAIRKLIPIFFDSAYKIKEAWDALLESSENDEAVIDVQTWMNHFSLDSIGTGGFSHDFGTLRGQHSTIAEIFDSFGKYKPTFFQTIMFLFSMVLPILARIPSPRRTLERKFKSAAEEISRELLNKSRKEKVAAIAGKVDNSVLGTLIHASDEISKLHMSEDEVVAQIRVLILAGYETTSVSLTWALIELSKNPSFQTKLREELASHYNICGDPTYDQLNSNLPHLDAMVHEVLRMHPPLWEMTRIATDDDIIPLSVPIRTTDNKLVDRVSIAAGQAVSVSIRTVNRSRSIWGADAKEFKPQRWLDEGGAQGKAKEIQGYRHLLTFADGPRTCLGRAFALAEFKAALSVLVRNYTFELRDGVDTQFEMGRTILPRPKVVGEEGCRMPLRIRRVE